MKWLVLVLGFIWYLSIEIHRGRSRNGKIDSVLPLSIIGIAGLIISIIIALVI
ncbi:hypothetical protein [Sulfidibacter corallicola]|uniref:Uncharacterized protein n=1 Tax=Sulfidibacter corallicola TaxID=2818388 RepID=A0A8A4TFP8_SULCO|nr:hypothetical protein [Sulfidibacter corallicola]QTD48909.1 hypothetical protein J3U87_25275 [Sulfidibacter corallicola]